MIVNRSQTLPVRACPARLAASDQRRVERAEVTIVIRDQIIASLRSLRPNIPDVVPGCRTRTHLINSRRRTQRPRRLRIV
jgi:hypothetical protein